MRFAAEGYPYIVGATLLAALTFMLALKLRSWPLWLSAFGLTLLALVFAWSFRSPVTGVGS
jgi:hypothetical protein